MIFAIFFRLILYMCVCFYRFWEEHCMEHLSLRSQTWNVLSGKKCSCMDSKINLNWYTVNCCSNNYNLSFIHCILTISDDHILPFPQFSYENVSDNLNFIFICQQMRMMWCISTIQDLGQMCYFKNCISIIWPIIFF